jgi:hypothetical protein
MKGARTSRIDQMSNDKLTLNKTQGNATLVPNHHAADPSRRRTGFFLQRRQLILAFIIFNIAVWTLLIVITFR